MTHPLTDEISNQILDSIPELPCDEQGHRLSYDGQRILNGMFEECDETTLAEMRAAADWQLEHVLKWLDDYLDHFGDSDEYYQGNCESIFDLKDHLKKAMRPTTTTTTQEDS